MNYLSADGIKYEYSAVINNEMFSPATRSANCKLTRPLTGCCQSATICFFPQCDCFLLATFVYNNRDYAAEFQCSSTTPVECLECSI